MEIRDATGRVLARLEVDVSANGRRLEITSALTGESRHLDALLLETLTWIPGWLLGPADAGELG